MHAGEADPPDTCRSGTSSWTWWSRAPSCPRSCPPPPPPSCTQGPSCRPGSCPRRPAGGPSRPPGGPRAAPPQQGTSPLATRPSGRGDAVGAPEHEAASPVEWEEAVPAGEDLHHGGGVAEELVPRGEVGEVPRHQAGARVGGEHQVILPEEGDGGEPGVAVP